MIDKQGKELDVGDRVGTSVASKYSGVGLRWGIIRSIVAKQAEVVLDGGKGRRVIVYRPGDQLVRLA